jgi:DNA replication and repair protein RecF
VLIDSAYLNNFRNVVDSTLSFSPNINLILGDNAQGKTSILEGIYLLICGKSFRTTGYNELLTHSQSSGAIKCKFNTSNGLLERELIINKDKKLFYQDSKLVNSISSLIGQLVTVVFTPDDLWIIKGSPVERRKFIDKHLVDLNPNLLLSMRKYEKAIKTKNQLLKSDAPLNHLLPWTEVISKLAFQIVKARVKLIKLIQDICANLYQTCFNVAEEISLSYFSSILGRYEDNLISEVEYQNLLISKLANERKAKISLYGPHRDDLNIFINGKEAKNFSSQGQIRSLVLSLKLSLVQLIEEKRGESPIVLLDDVDSELDFNRRNTLISNLLSQQRQVIITSTTISGFTGMLGFKDSLDEVFSNSVIYKLVKGRVVEGKDLF